jgi:hypothetical protein
MVNGGVRLMTKKPGSSIFGTGVGSVDLKRTWMPWAVMVFDGSVTTVVVPTSPSATTVTPRTAWAADHAVVHSIKD